MSLQFCFTSTPNIQATAFRLLVLFDEKVDQSVWDAVEAQIEQNLADQVAYEAAFETDLVTMQNTLISIRSRLLELGS